MPNQKYLYIPVEIYRRELNGMLMLSLLAAQRGWRVVVGGKKVIFPRLNILPEGIVLTKSIVPGELENTKRIISEGHRVVTLDAEGLIIEQGKLGATSRFSSETIAQVERVFFWGTKQYERVKKFFPEVAKVAVVVGSPILDYWRYQKVVSARKEKRQKKVILIATSFPFPNHVISEELGRRLFAETFGKNLSNEQAMEEFFPMGNLLKIVYPQFKDFVENLIANNSDCHFILRPHISENPAPWVEIGAKFSNVEMSLTENFSSVLARSDMLIHFNSTTSIEACFHGKAVLTYIPIQGITERHLSILNEDALAASVVCRSLDESQQRVNELKSGTFQASTLGLDGILHEQASTNVANSCLHILDSIDSLAFPSRRSFPGFFAMAINVEMIRRASKLRVLWLVAWLDHLTGIFSGKYALSKDMFKYGNTKQGRVDFSELRSLFNDFVQEFKLEQSQFQIRELKNGMYEVSATSTGAQ